MNDSRKIDLDTLELSPAELVALINQTLDYAYPSVLVVGELANFRVSRNKWVYFDLKDDTASVKFFGTIYSLPGPLEDGMKLSVRARPHLHEQYGFSMQVSSIQPVGEGAIKKAAELLSGKLEAEGLFDPQRKRPLPYPPHHVALVTSVQSAAYADFTKVLSDRFGGLVIDVYDVQVQGEQAVIDISEAIATINKRAELPEVVVVTRGGGSADDLAAFNHESVVRAIAASRVPTLVAIGHEIDVSLAERAADCRASTPSNAAELLVPHRREVLAELTNKELWLHKGLVSQLHASKDWLRASSVHLDTRITTVIARHKESLATAARLLEILSPQAVLNRGYALVKQNGMHVKSVATVSVTEKLELTLADGTLQVRVE